jgi:hypothetical protein
MNKALLELLYMELTVQYEWVFSQPIGRPVVWGAWDGFRV